MSWVFYVLLGAPINALVNTGYKLYAGSSLFLFAGCVTGITALCLLAYGLFIRGDQISVVGQGHTPWVIVVMGVAGAMIMYLFISAVTKGPITLVDPMWACLYALVSALIGMALLREAPSALALSGVALYVVGAVLMSRG
jgi:uncharacterized membrane protein